MITDRHDKRSNRCAKCGHTYTSTTHRTRCKGMSVTAARSAARANRRRSGGSYTSKRTASEVLHSRIAINSDFWRTDSREQEPRS
jgi:hypothetical protein